MTTITLYWTAGCHLCEIAQAMLNELSPIYSLTIIHIEIGDDAKLVAQYGATIPVLKLTDDSELNWPFSKQDIEQRLNK